MTKPNTLPELAVLQHRFVYCAESGILKYRVKVNGTKFGAPVGCVSAGGYLHVKISGTLYYTHRIIWKMYYGEDPPAQIDHINHDRVDNRISNLRVVSARGNSKNRSLRKDNKSGTTGVYWDKKRGGWCASAAPFGKEIYLGFFINKSDAIKTRAEADERYGFHKNHGRDI